MWSFSRPWFVTNSTLEVSGSTFKGMTGICAYNLDRGRVFVRHSLFDVSIGGVAFSDIRDSHVAVEGNTIAAQNEFVQGVTLWAGNIGTGITTSSLWFANNLFTGLAGISADPRVLAGVKCEAVNNDVTAVAVPYVFNDNECKVRPKL